MTLSSKDYAIHNQMEDLADLAIQQVISEDPDACGCPFCRSDMKCLILNRLQPAYQPVAELDRGRLARLEDLERELFDQIMVETHRALALVKSGPRHQGKRSPLHNELEEFVVIALREVLNHQEQTLTFAQLSRVMAAVLSDLRPRYTTTYKGSAFPRTIQIDPDYLARIYSSIYAAFNKLKAKSE